ncbi:uncharacterized protein LOC105171438 isoform X2 [Sesamum indicum]|uniref:Uncharacterized protein LOC105171438 isoform X2 n=1 Tax=Sesamum indicum TaxID=4182 RepID=A0A6I9TXD9_SESIN|nr:uncharacterized protein LOC105171438 isoform X2 [Sesamum indicum]
MVCSIASGKMTALARLLDAGSVSQSATEEVSHQKLAAQYIKRELGEADEENLLDEEDMHIFGLRPMTDPLDLVCCNACRKPIKASQYAAHAELCKSLSSRAEISLELDGPAVNKKPPRKERKKLLISQTKKATSLREPKKFESVDSDGIAASESHVNEKIQMSAIAKRNMHLSSTDKMNGSRVNPYTIDCAEDVTKRASKPLKRTAAESPSNPGTKNFCKPAADILPYAPAPLATKVYYSQRNHHLRRAISYMFFEETSKESSCEVSNLEILQANAVPQQTSSPSNCYHEQVANQQRDDHFSHLAQTPDQILAARSDFFVSQSEGFVPSMNMAPQHPVNNTLGPHYISNSYSFAGKAGNSLGTLQQGSGSVPVV